VALGISFQPQRRWHPCRARRPLATKCAASCRSALRNVPRGTLHPPSVARVAQGDFGPDSDGRSVLQLRPMYLAKTVRPISLQGRTPAARAPEKDRHPFSLESYSNGAGGHSLSGYAVFLPTPTKSGRRTCQAQDLFLLDLKSGRTTYMRAGKRHKCPSVGRPTPWERSYYMPGTDEPR
jgi:hypothetical protein